VRRALEDLGQAPGSAASVLLLWLSHSVTPPSAGRGTEHRIDRLNSSPACAGSPP
jgi:hypothetical protein